MNTEEIKEYLLDFQKRELPVLVDRDIKIPETRKIKSIIGPRRAGKTYLMYQQIMELLKSGISKKNIIYLNFEDPRLIEVNFKEIREIIKIHWQLYPLSTKENFHVFIDEPQNIKNWESAVRALYDEGFDIFISGSSSKLLSKEIATSLRGRSISYNILPFSFEEFLKVRNKVFDVKRLSSKEKSLLLNLLNEYMEFGGFPEILIEKETESKIKIINEYFNSIVYKDIVERYKIKNIQLVRWLIKSLISSFSKEFSVHKIYLTLKGKSIKVSKNTLYSYLSMLEDSLFVFFVPKFGYSIRKKDLSINKAYLCDVGFTKLTEIFKGKGDRIENIVFLELERRKKSLESISYWKNQQQEEVDFVVKRGAKTEQLIQVCYDITDIDTKKREIRALIKASTELKCSNLVVITENHEAVEKHNGKTVKIIPIWKWLISNL